MALMERDYCEAWPPELQEAEKRRFRAECKLRCLESNLDRISPAEFDALMDQIEATQEELYAAGQAVIRARASMSRTMYPEQHKETAQRNTH